MSLPFIESAGPYFVIAGVLVGGSMLLAGYVLDWIRSDEVGPGPLNGRSQTRS